MKVKKIKLRGKVIKGFGKGAYFLSIDPYRSFFKGLLGRDPYPGTLNVVIDGNVDGIKLPNEFRPKNFGAISYAFGKIGGLKIVVIRPHKSKHPRNVLEIVSDKFLRDFLKLRDGDEIEFEIFF